MRGVAVIRLLFSYYLASQSCSALQTTKPSLSSASLQRLNQVTSATHAQQILQQATQDSPNRLYASIKIPTGASSRGISDGDLAIQTRLVNKQYTIEELCFDAVTGQRDANRASWAVLCIMIASVSSTILVQSITLGPEILRFVVAWCTCFAPLFFAGYGIARTEQLQAVLANVQRQLFPSYRKRLLQHEAGHFLMGYLLGWPIQNYQLEDGLQQAVLFYPLADEFVGVTRAQQLGFDSNRKRRDETSLEEQKEVSAPFYSSQGRGQRELLEQSVFRKNANYDNRDQKQQDFSRLPKLQDPTTVWPYKGFSDAVLDQITVVSVAGVCAELLLTGSAEGGVADLQQLTVILKESSAEILTERDVCNKIRYALGFSMSQLRRHLGVLDALAEAMDEGKSIAECVYVMETCSNVSGQTLTVPDYELQRRQAYREGNWLERALLGETKHLDADEDRFVQGKGGGSRKETFRLTGDDPLYLALALSFCFFIWASNGGLSLH
ncbi:hypothetical protein FisN_23Lh027 [Fistulifera solaris]|uniref:Peptidase M41 domain-containing protein n=1 Tax=Fistulifera solaris TaxID=1519565 RepID=A0A1Z5KKA1_FISSO|nr:hypothetical protein FisN_23Lh027 [Fistulifera solaris]|eukprot:GAX26502.1 hypothetical protein FisN_23Lh027 [Fistulifera solaris]